MALTSSVVKWFDAKKGFGFLVHPQGGADIFVHYSQIEGDRKFKTLRTGEVVTFELIEGPKGIHAVKVSPVEDQSEAGSKPPEG